jgi:beta-ribofuranosylaminobenzene 5'-phosphate synthase
MRTTFIRRMNSIHKVTVKTSARLHLGILDTNGELGRIYGSIGVAIQRPNVELEAQTAERLTIEGLERERVERYARRFLEQVPLPFSIHLNLRSSIPSHVGLGSGTQLALAVGSALARLAGLEMSAVEVAALLGRGVHSGIGTATFQSGGFILDGGHRLGTGPLPGSAMKQSIPPVIFQHPFPEAWRFVIAIPQTSPGISGETEKRAFSTLPATPASLAEKISRLVMMKMLPSLIDQDIQNFGAALTGIQRLVGDSFAEVQGGRFANTLSERIISFFLDQHAYGAGQSSWGPAVYALVDGPAAAAKLEQDTQHFLHSLNGGTAFAVPADNRGAQVTASEE